MINMLALVLKRLIVVARKTRPAESGVTRFAIRSSERFLKKYISYSLQVTTSTSN